MQKLDVFTPAVIVVTILYIVTDHHAVPEGVSSTYEKTVAHFFGRMDVISCAAFYAIASDMRSWLTVPKNQYFFSNTGSLTK